MLNSAKIDQLRERQSTAPLRVQTLGSFQVWVDGEKISSKAWGRDRTVQLFQFLITARHRHALHKEQIVDRIWEELDLKGSEQVFKVAMHGINKALEPNRKSRTEPRFVIRQGQTYQLNMEKIWVDADAVDQYIALGNQCLPDDKASAKIAFQEAIALYRGAFLPSRLYEDWTSAERERIQILALGTTITLGELLLEENPLESIRLAQQALLLDPTWEDAYRLEMQAYLQEGNRPMAIKTYQTCVKVLDEEFGIQPLPETRRLMELVRSR